MELEATIVLSPSNEQVKAGEIARGAIQLGKDLCRKEIRAAVLEFEITTFILDNGGKPALKGFKPSFKDREYQYSICLARNEQVVHGIPHGVVYPSDITTIDLVVEYDGWHADTARTFTYGKNLDKQYFVYLSSQIFQAGLDTIICDGFVNNYGMVIEHAADLHNLGVIKEFCGHGIGRLIHAEPQILNYNSMSNDIFTPGCSYAIEPVLAESKDYVLSEAKDGWTVKSNCLTSHNEDTIFVSRAGVVNLTGKQS